MSAPLQVGKTLEAAAEQARSRAASYLAGLQRHDGHWCAELTADTTLESDFILFQLWLYPPRDGKWEPKSRVRVDKAARSILERQLPDGGFNIFRDGPSEISASAKAYVALKLAGLAADDPPMRKLRRRILEMGGLQAANSYVKVNLSLFDLYPREYCPSIPPEVMLMPFHFLYQMSSWTRAIVASLAIVHAANPRRPVPAGFTLDEIWLEGASPRFHWDERLFTWHNVFLAGDRFLKWWERHGSKRLRRRAVEAAREWMIERMHRSDGLGAIYPPMMYSIMALDLLGYGPASPERKKAQRHFDDLLIDKPDRFQFQPCYSVVWDTALALFTLGEAGAAVQESTAAASRWLVSKEVRRKGDWAIKRPKTEPGGWYFEFANEFYPDVDDTAMVLLALTAARDSGVPGLDEAARRGIDWALAMQSKDGGWAAFDVDNNWDWLNNVPFADHNAMLDPTCPDITGRVLEALARWGVGPDHPAVQRGVRYLRKSQERDGSWYGRWGVDYIYGTFLALRGLRAAGYDDHEAEVLRAGEWLRSIQNADGGWGETCASYDQRGYVAAPSTPSQTAWAVLGLLAGGDTTSESVRRGIEYLIGTQREDGGWNEALATGTGFPRVFYLLYHLYRDVFPVLALAEYQKVTASGGERRG